MSELLTDLIESGKRDNHMTTATETQVHPLIIAFIAYMQDIDDETELDNLLQICDNESAFTPIEQLVTELALQTDEYGDNKIAANEWEEVWNTLYALIEKDPSRIPADAVYTALTEEVEKSEASDGLGITNLTDLALLIPSFHAAFPSETLTGMCNSDVWEVRQKAVEVCKAYKLWDVCQELATDDDEDVATAAVQSLPLTPETRTLLVELLADNDLHDQVRAAAVQVMQTMDEAQA